MSLTIRGGHWHKSSRVFWSGRQVRALVDLPTGGREVIPAGSVLVVTGKSKGFHGGLNLQAHCCKRCGVAIHAHRDRLSGTRLCRGPRIRWVGTRAELEERGGC